MGLNEILENLRQQVGASHAKINSVIDSQRQLVGDTASVRQELLATQQNVSNLATALASLRTNGAGSSVINSPGGRSIVKADNKIRYLEDIPGRRIPFDIVVRIPVGANVTSLQQQTHIISQDGPFVAVARYACFQSAYQFQVTSEQGVATFQGRSFGRFRPIHSMWDVNDAQAFNPIVGMAFPGTGAPIVASPSSHSGFRSMEFDGLVTFKNQGAAYPRSNVEVPTAWWTTQINSPFQLAALDFFERGETLQWEVTPSHVNNPEAGNVNGFVGSFPFLASQYDVHEGIVDTASQETTDPVTRLPNGFVYIGLHGFRIIQPPGPVEM